MNCQALPMLSNYLQNKKSHRMKEKLHCSFLRDTHMQTNVCVPFIDANLKSSCFLKIFCSSRPKASSSLSKKIIKTINHFGVKTEMAGGKKEVKLYLHLFLIQKN